MKKDNIEIVRRTSPDGSIEDTIIYGLEEGEEQYYKILGTSSGITFAHCFSLGAKHKDNFLKRVFAYKIIPDKDHIDLLKKVTRENYISVEFYELA